MATTTKATELSQLSSALQVDESTGEIIFTGSLSVDSNTLFIDADSNRVGIGTLTPSSALEIAGALVASGAIRSEEEYTQIAQGFIQREGTRGDLDVDLAVAIELNLIGFPVAGGYYAGLIDTTGDGSIQSNDDYQSGQRYALIVSDKSLEGGRGSSPASGLPTGDLEWDTQDRTGEAGCFTRWNGLEATNVIIAKNDTSYEVHDFIEAVRSQYPAATTPGGSEWYLPAMDELELLYRNFKPNNADNRDDTRTRVFPGTQVVGTNPSSAIEGFQYENSPRIPDVTFLDLFKEGNAQSLDQLRYWSTTDADDDGRAWFQFFTDSGGEGFQNAFRKELATFSVRPVRRVVLDDSNDTKNRSGNYNINGSITAHGLNTDGGDVSFTEDTGTTPKFYWDASAERLGIGTSSPNNILHISGGNGPRIEITDTDTNKDFQLRCFQGNGFLLANANIAFFPGIDEAVRVTSGGNLLVGTTLTNGLFNGTASNDGVTIEQDPTTVKIQSEDNTNLFLSKQNVSSSDELVDIYVGGTKVGSITSNGSSTSFNTSSDYRLKENVTELSDGIERIKHLPVHRFNFIADPEKTVDGFIAHEVQPYVPEAVTGEKDEVDEDGNPEYQGIDQAKLVPVLTAALQEAVAKIESLEARIETLENN